MVSQLKIIIGFALSSEEQAKHQGQLILASEDESAKKSHKSEAKRCRLIIKLEITFN
jgi:hypothetical protein